jgi:hypothetical protein
VETLLIRFLKHRLPLHLRIGRIAGVALTLPALASGAVSPLLLAIMSCGDYPGAPLSNGILDVFALLPASTEGYRSSRWTVPTSLVVFLSRSIRLPQKVHDLRSGHDP